MEEKEAFRLSRIQAAARALSLLLISCLFALGSCNGNGLAFESEPYTGPSVSSSSSSSSSSTASSYWPGISGSGTVSADELLTLSNSGDTDTILTFFDGTKARTTTISFSPPDIGLPAGGYVTLMITGSGVAYTADASASPDGRVYFQVPQIEDGTTITVSIVVKEADGTVVCFGSKTQTVSGGSSSISVSLSGGSAGTTDDDEDDAWTLPDPPTVSATPTGVDYRHSVSPVPTVRLEVLGLTDPPSGSLSYAWTNALGAAIGSDAKVIDVPVTDIIGAAPDTLPAGDSNLTVGLVLTYTDADGNTQTSSASCPVTVTIHRIPSFELQESTLLPAGMAVHSASSYDVSDLNQTLTVIAEPASGSSFRTGTEFSWTVNGTPLLDASGNPVTTASAPIRLSDHITAASLSTTTPVQLTIACTASDSWATNSPTAPVTKTLDFYKPVFPTPVIDIPTYSGTYIGYDAATATYSFYAVAGASDPAGTSITFSLTNESSFLSGTTYDWKLNGNSMWGSSASATPSGTVLGAITGFSMASGTGSFTVVCEATDGSMTATSATVTVKILRYPSSIPSFTTMFDSVGGDPIAGDVGYKVSSAHGVSVKAVGTGLPENGSGAVYSWYINGTKIKDGSKEDSFTVADLTAAGAIPDASALGVWSGAGSESNGTRIDLSCTISYPGLTLSKSSDVSSGGNDWTRLFHQ
ncbi:MAG: hypothetical protein K6G18_07555 [Treponema sp.]|nr:hypothetical protein [Treponema sp.]